MCFSKQPGYVHYYHDANTFDINYNNTIFLQDVVTKTPIILAMPLFMDTVVPVK